VPAPESRRALVEKLGSWFDEKKRDLPWRRTKDPYAIWISEVMLQQTRVATVLEYYPRFLAAYPTVSSLAKAPLADVLGHWSGLGYYRRARALHAGAREVVTQYGAKLPREASALREISGIGPYTAGAVASIAFGQKEPLVDGNVARVLARVFAVETDMRSPKGVRESWALAAALVPAHAPGRHNEALMELGATVCLPTQPRCEQCPVSSLCEARQKGIQNELPVVKKKKAPRAVEMVALVIRRDDQVLLGRRREGGLFGGLWEPPMIEANDGHSPGAALSELLGVGPRALTKLTTVGRATHILTHRKLSVTIATGKLVGTARASGAVYEVFQWHPHELGNIGISSLAKKVLLACPS
jgi:A/G-specific adenine glycosylase